MSETLSVGLGALVSALPKAELHVHLEGSTPAALAGRWATRQGSTIPGLTQNAQGQWNYTFSGFAQFIECYIALSHCICEPGDLEDLATAVARDMAAQKVRYAEMTFTPTTHLARNWEHAALIQALHAATAAAAAQGVQWGWVFDFVRSYPDTAEPTVDFALQARESGLPVVGFGVGGPEGDQWPGELIASAFDRAIQAGLASVPHAGENRGAQGVREAIELLGAKRIGHGIRAVEDAAVLELVAQRQVCLEICPTSNLHLLGIPSLDAHPLREIQQTQVLWTLASDDPPLVGTTLNQEYLRCAQAYQWDAPTLRRVAENSFKSAFIDEQARLRYLSEIESDYSNWESSQD